MVTDTGHWIASEVKLDPKGAIGFVYVIIEKTTNKLYIGKKNFKGTGKKNKNVESNWKTYCSSSKSLQDLIKEKGVDSFEFIILEQYYTRGGLSFAETWSQVTCEVPSNNHRFFNRFIDKTTFKVTEPVTPRHKKRLRQVLKNYPLQEEKEDGHE